MNKIPLTFILYLDKHRDHCCFYYDSLLTSFVIKHDLEPDFPICDQHVYCQSDHVWMHIVFPVRIRSQSFSDALALLNELNADSPEAGSFILDTAGGEVCYRESVVLTSSAWQLAKYVFQKGRKIIRQYAPRLVEVLKPDPIYQIYLDKYLGFKH